MSRKPVGLSEDGRKAGVTFYNEDCNNRIIANALEKLDNATGIFDGKDLSRFMKIKNGYDQQCKIVRRAFKKLIDTHAHMEPLKDKEGKDRLDASGKPIMVPRQVPAPGGMGYDYKDPKAFKKDYKLLMSDTFKVEAYRLTTDSLIKAELSPKEIRALAMILTDSDDSLVKDRDPQLEEDDDEDDYDASEEVSSEESLDEPAPAINGASSDTSDEPAEEVNNVATPDRPVQPNQSF